jgi:superoxide dismutase, Cu-Zn family
LFNVLVSTPNKTVIMKRLNSFFAFLTFAFLMTEAGAQDKPTMPAMGTTEAKQVHPAVCVLYPTQGNEVSGKVTFTQVNDGVKVVIDLKGLSKGKHGIHIHECGDCTAPDASSAGGHYNPAMKSHGAPMDATRHAGDMGNIEADATGNAHLEYVDKTISLSGDESIIGRSVVVHKGEDDLKTQPSGNSGPRVACGVIGIGK